nr:S-adenosylmethionine synthetase [Planctomycetales bacterium]NIM09651.1 S-adenosylmethionine synthetase [Planctomycetales bacterium]NIN09134.1 S-adenosylmethionine synthetase [Planctomycetales bacterium]NIN78241.1 S-adenosylmethionine synthetase [Planctomycetales bacterium]NIO35432.1 S-adenosylmethionine synthetase [Planctomycetales bacterium]
MHEITVETLDHRPVGQQQFEYVERKGLGHPDSICDAVMESVSVALGQAYRQSAGHLLHYNLDKGLLVAGETSPALGGGLVNAPMRFVFGDRATREYQNGTIPVDEIIESTARQWFTDHLRFVEPDQHLIFQNEIKSGSPELVDIFARHKIVANDTSAAV